MPETVNMHEAKTQLSRLVRRAEAGEEIVISRAGKPVAKLSAYMAPGQKRRGRGSLRGQIVIHDDFDDPLPEDIQAAFAGRGP
jgi:prevent-host-death family protein